MPEVSEDLSETGTQPSVANAAPAVPSAVKLSPAAREKWIEQMLVEHESSLIDYAAFLVHDSNNALVVVRDTFLELCQRDVPTIRETIRPWLFATCRNRALDFLRKDKRTQPLEDIRWKKVAGPGVETEEQSADEERLSNIARHMARLTEKQREVIVLKLRHGLSYQEIHRVTGLTTGNIGFLIHTGLKRLRESIPDTIQS